jgi:asparagine synthase (glutamine-hydrolysing)
VEGDDWALAWSVSRGAPLDVQSDRERAALLVGDAWLPGVSNRVRAPSLAALWREPGCARALDGFHLGICRYEDGLIVVGADLLGLFPVYWWQAPGGGTVVASSTAVVARHPGYRHGIDVEGLAGLLLAGSTLDGRTLLPGVRRLAPGHLLVVSPGRPPEEVQQYSYPTQPTAVEDPGTDAVDGLHEALSVAMDRAMDREGRQVVLLSGGRDSRLLAGYAAASGRAVGALCLGLPTDFECVAARKVARRLGLDLDVRPIPLGRYGELALRHVYREAVHAPLAGMHNLGIPDLVGPGDSALVAGHLLEVVLIGRWAEHRWATQGERGLPSRKQFWTSLQSGAIPEPDLARLVRDRALKEALRGTRDGIDRRIREASFLDDVRRFLVRHWCRAHPGGALWRFAGSAWPVTPVLDQEVMAAGARVAAAHPHGREAHDLLLTRHFPGLTRAPLVRGDGTLDPIRPDVSWKVREFARRWAMRRGLAPDGPQWHRRRYRRIYDFDNEGWRAVRRRAEPARDELLRWFHRESLVAYLPPPQENTHVDCPITDSYGRKLLTSLALWIQCD